MTIHYNHDKPVSVYVVSVNVKVIDAIRDKGIGAVGNLAGKAFSAAKDKIMSLVRKKPPVVKPLLPSTTVMSAKISKKTSVVGCFGGSVADDGSAGNR